MYLHFRYVPSWQAQRQIYRLLKHAMTYSATKFADAYLKSKPKIIYLNLM